MGVVVGESELRCRGPVERGGRVHPPPHHPLKIQAAKYRGSGRERKMIDKAG